MSTYSAGDNVHAAQPLKRYTDLRSYVLHYGIKDKKSKKMQINAFYKMQQRVFKREDVAKAMVISGNVLSLSIMSSQLSMYRWKVTEAQSLSEATSRLLDEVKHAFTLGYQVRRVPPARPTGKSKYSSKEAMDKLFALRIEQSLRRSERREQRKKAAAAAGEDIIDAMDNVVDSKSVSLSDVSSEVSSISSRSSSVCSAEEAPRDDADGQGDGQYRNAPPPGMLTSLVIVDCFTHEPYNEILDHLRFIDKQHDLNLCIILILPQNDDSKELQGAGAVLVPQHQFAYEDAYELGYDLVLTHCFDNAVVEFLTETFVSAAGRWRNDVRAKAAVGNYMSLKNILKGRIDMEVLKALVWNENIDDAELLNIIGQQSLALHGEAKRISAAGQQLLKQQHSTKEEEERTAESNTTPGVFPASVSRFRARALPNTSGVTKREDFNITKPIKGGSDMFSSVLAPAPGKTKHLVRRRRKGADPSDESEEAYEYTLMTMEEQEASAVHKAFEGELKELLEESAKKSKLIDTLTGDVERLTRTVSVLKKIQVLTPEVQEPVLETNLDAFGTSLMNLSKEQQIYILKERLDLANSQLAVLQSESSNHRSRPNSRGDRVGSSNSITSMFKNASRENKKLAARRKKRYRIYNEHREADFLSLLDVDANRASAVEGEENVKIIYIDTSKTENNGKKKKDTGKRDMLKKSGSSGDDSLSSSLKSAFEGDKGRDGKSSFQDAMELVSSQQDHIKQLEATNKEYQERLESLERARKLSKVEILSMNSEGSKSKKRRKKGESSPRSQESRRKSSTDGTVSPGGRGKRSPAKKGPDKEALERNDALIEEIRSDLAFEYERKIEKALKKQERKHKKELVQRGDAITGILERIYLRQRQPYTQENIQLLKEEREEENAKAMGCKQRLDYHLGKLRPEQIKSSEVQDLDASSRGVVSRVREAESAQLIQELAEKYARHTLRSKELTEEIKNVEKFIKSEEGKALLNDAVQELEEAQHHTEMVAATDPDINEYLNSWERQLKAREKIQKWGFSSLFDYSRSRGGKSTASESSLPFPISDYRRSRTSFASMITSTASLPKEISIHEERSEPLNPESDVLLEQMQCIYDLATKADYKENMKRQRLKFTGSESKERRSRKGGSISRRAVEEESEDSQWSSSSDSDEESLLSPSAEAKTAKKVDDAQPTFLTNTSFEQQTKSADEIGAPSHSELGSAGAYPSVQPHSTDERPVSVSKLEQSLGKIDPRTSLSILRSNPSLSPFQSHIGKEEEMEIRSDGTKHLYNVILENYRSGLIHPERMVSIEKIVEKPPEKISIGELAEEYLVLHQETYRLLALLAFRTPELNIVLSTHTDDEEKKLVAELLQIVSTPQNLNSCSTISFLMEYDTAIVTWCVDFLLRTMREVGERGGRHVALPPRLLRHLSFEDERFEYYEDIMTLTAQSDGAGFAASYQRSTGSQRTVGKVPSTASFAFENNKPFSVESEPSRSRASLSRSKRCSPQSRLGSREAGENDDLGSEDMAALLGNQRESGPELDLAELYLEDDEEKDENAQLMATIRRELEYLEQVKEERLAELRLRYKYRKKQIAVRRKLEYDHKTAKEEAEEREVPDFEVKSGAPSWYGMEAQKRLREILRRRRGPMQVTVGGGTSVGQEISRRTAFEPPEERRFSMLLSLEERMRAAHRILPPLKRKGLSNWQIKLQRGMQSLQDNLGYTNPREAAIINAFGSCARMNQGEDDGPTLGLPDDVPIPPRLSDRVLAFRETLLHMGQKGPVDVLARLQQQLGHPYFKALRSGSIPRSPATKPPPYEKLDVSKWVYGVSNEDLQSAMDRPPSGNRKGSVVFLPSGKIVCRDVANESGHETRCSMGTSCTGIGRGQHQGIAVHSGEYAGGKNVLPTQNSIYNPYKTLHTQSYITPSALAAQRLASLIRGAPMDPFRGDQSEAPDEMALSGTAITNTSLPPSPRPTAPTMGPVTGRTAQMTQRPDRPKPLSRCSRDRRADSPTSTFSGTLTDQPDNTGRRSCDMRPPSLGDRNEFSPDTASPDHRNSVDGSMGSPFLLARTNVFEGTIGEQPGNRPNSIDRARDKELSESSSNQKK